jgi:hypothetical protein
LGEQGDLDASIEYLEQAVYIKPDVDKFKDSLGQQQAKKSFTGKTLQELYLQHTGKVSDKWSLYLSVYDQILKSYRNANVRLLEIGVQNGGSLEIWSKYFSNAKLIVGCDINPECGKLRYDEICKIETIPGQTDGVFQNKKNRQCIEDNYKISTTIISCSSDALEALWGFNLEEVKQIKGVNKIELMLKGWVLGRKSKVDVIEVIHNHMVVKQVAVNLSRPDVARAYSYVHDAETSGFITIIDIGELSERGEFLIQAVCSDQSRIPLQKIQFEIVTENQFPPGAISF